VLLEAYVMEDAEDWLEEEKSEDDYPNDGMAVLPLVTNEAKLYY